MGNRLAQQQQIILAVDCVGSTMAKELVGDKRANVMIGAALNLAEETYRAADQTLTTAGPSSGDSILMIGGSDAVEIYRASIAHQSTFRAWYYNRMPVKIAIGFGEFESIEDSRGGFSHSRGKDLDFLYRILDFCPPAGVVVTPAMFAILDEAGFGERFIKVQEDLKGYGLRVFYESNGDYQISPDHRQRAKRRKTDLEPKVEPKQTTISLSELLAMLLLFVLAIIVFNYLKAGA
jgi:hypothetical protein